MGAKECPAWPASECRGGESRRRSLIGHDKIHLATTIWFTAHVLYVELMRGTARAGALRAVPRRRPAGFSSLLVHEA